MGVVCARFLLPIAVTVAVGAAFPALLWMNSSATLNAQNTNQTPEFLEGDSAIRVVAAGTAANQNVGGPVKAADPDPGDTLTYSLAGSDAAHFSVNSGTGQILTKGALDYDTKGSYSVTVQVTDGADDSGNPDSAIDDAIEVTIRVSVTVDLSDWTAEYYQSNTQYCDTGAWRIDGNGRAKETGGRAPSILYGDFDAYGKRLTATVNPGNDNAFIGFVVGFDLGDSTNTSADYLLIDWMYRGREWDFTGDSTSPGGTSATGLRLSRVTGKPDCDEFWQHDNLSGTPVDEGVEELQIASTKGNSRYNQRQHYEFVIDFGPGSIEVFVDGSLELDVDGTFGNGKFGAYAMLHNSATFWDFTYTDGSFPSEPVDQPGTVTLSSTTPEVGVALTATLTDADGGVANESWQWEISPNQTPASWTAISNATTSSYTPAVGGCRKTASSHRHLRRCLGHRQDSRQWSDGSIRPAGCCDAFIGRAGGGSRPNSDSNGPEWRCDQRGMGLGRFAGPSGAGMECNRWCKLGDVHAGVG